MGGNKSAQLFANTPSGIISNTVNISHLFVERNRFFRFMGFLMSDPIPELMRMHEVRQTTGLSRAYIYLLERNGKFPRRVKIGKVSAYVRSEIGEFIWQRIVERDQK